MEDNKIASVNFFVVELSYVWIVSSHVTSDNVS